MSRTVTLGKVKERVRALADLENSAFIQDPVLLQFIDDAYCELVDILAAADIHLFETEVDITTDGVNDTYILPADHYKTLSVDYEYAPNQWRPLEVQNFATRRRYRFSPGWATHYRDAAGNMVLYPLPPGVQTYRHTYVPCPAKLSQLADDWTASAVKVIGDEVINGGNIYICTTGGTTATSGGPTGTGTGITDGSVVWDFSIAVDDTAIDGIAGWDKFLVVLAGKLCCIKGDLSTVELEKEEAKQRARIDQMAMDRQQPTKIADVRSRDWRRAWRNQNWIF